MKQKRKIIKNRGVDVEDERFYSIEEVAKILNVSDGAVRKWLKARALKGIKLGRIWRIRESDFDKFLKKGKAQGKRKSGYNIYI